MTEIKDIVAKINREFELDLMYNHTPIMDEVYSDDGYDVYSFSYLCKQDKERQITCMLMIAHEGIIYHFFRNGIYDPTISDYVWTEWEEYLPDNNIQEEPEDTNNNPKNYMTAVFVTESKLLKAIEEMGLQEEYKKYIATYEDKDGDIKYELDVTELFKNKEDDKLKFFRLLGISEIYDYVCWWKS